MSRSPHHLADLGVVIVAAGRGTRLGAPEPKAYVEVGGSPLIAHAIRTVTRIDDPGQLVLVVPEGAAQRTLDIVADAVLPDSPWQVSVVTGGRERHESVRKGLEALGPSVETVLVHDAARPGTPLDVFARVIDGVRQHRVGVVPALPVADVLKRVDDTGIVRSTEDRAGLVAVQTPQGFPRELLEAAHETAQAREEAASPDNDAPADDAEVVQRFGGEVRTVPGSPSSHKITFPSDLILLSGLLDARA